MHVIGHQAVPEQRKRIELYVLAQEVEIDSAFSIARQNELPRIASLRYVMRNINY
jgi:hypothetical protein